MLEKILNLLETCSLTKEQIVQKLDISIPELNSVLEYLSQMGFIKATTIIPSQGSCSSGCGGNCGKCSHTCTHTNNSSYVVWELI